MKAIDRSVLDRVVKFIDKDNCLDEEDLAYFPEKYPITRDEFNELNQALDDLAESKKAVIRLRGMFPTFESHYTYQGTNFTLSTMSGQGTVTTFCSEDFNPKHVRFRKDKAIVLDGLFPGDGSEG